MLPCSVKAQNGQTSKEPLRPPQSILYPACLYAQDVPWLFLPRVLPCPPLSLGVPWLFLPRVYPTSLGPGCAQTVSAQGFTLPLSALGVPWPFLPRVCPASLCRLRRSSTYVLKYRGSYLIFSLRGQGSDDVIIDIVLWEPEGQRIGRGRGKRGVLRWLNST